MDGRRRKRTRQTFENSTFLDSIEAQPFASYETIPVVTRSGAIRPSESHKTSCGEVPPIQKEAEVEAEPVAEDPPHDAGDDGYIADDTRDDVLGGMELPRNGRLRKVRAQPICRGRKQYPEGLNNFSDTSRLHPAVRVAGP